MQKNKNLNTLSLFSGGGGLDLGFAASGYSILISTDIDDYSCNTLINNKAKNGLFNGCRVINDDIKNISRSRLSKEFKINKSDINVVIGGLPYHQAFMTLT